MSSMTIAGGPLHDVRIPVRYDNQLMTSNVDIGNYSLLLCSKFPIIWFPVDSWDDEEWLYVLAPRLSVYESCLISEEVNQECSAAVFDNGMNLEQIAM